MLLTPPSDPPKDSPLSAILQVKQQSQIRKEVRSLWPLTTSVTMHSHLVNTGQIVRCHGYE